MAVQLRPPTEDQARQIAGRCVDPINADSNKIALFAATGEIEGGLVEAVGDALDYARANEDMHELAEEVSPLEELWAYLQGAARRR